MLEQSNILSYNIQEYTIHQGQQDKHIEGTKNYNQQLANGENDTNCSKAEQKYYEDEFPFW
ncbi:MAG: hypothetical protein FWE02_02615 [Defluviitaleaceae bacterium]|nr:hypothetical protein [Defluviitaleaceae bacterium]